MSKRALDSAEEGPPGNQAAGGLMVQAQQTVPQSGVLRRKPIASDSTGSGLERSIGLWQLTAIGIGAIIGAGIFSLAGTVANGTAGPAVSVSFLIAGIASACAAL